MADTLTEEIAAEAARLVVESGLEYGPAKHKAARALGRRGGGRGNLPDNEQVEDQVREYLSIFCAETQPAELAALRRLAAQWMRRLPELRPHLGGAVWRGTATRLSAIRIDLYCDDPKAAGIALLNLGIAHDVGTLDPGGPSPLDVLTVAAPCRELGETATLHFIVQDFDALRGALKPDARGQAWRGDLAALERLLSQADAPAQPSMGSAT